MPHSPTTAATPAPRPRRRALAAAALAALAGLALAPALAQEPAPGAAPAVTPAAQPPKSDGSVDVAALMSPGPLPDVVIGQADAPVTIVEYASMTCPHCADFHASAYPAIKAAYIDTGKAKLVLREFPFDPQALAAFMMARCVGASDPERRTRMVDVLFDQQESWARAESVSAALLSIGKLAGLTEEQFRACLADKTLQANVVSVQQRGQTEFGVNATPTFFINGDKYAGALSAEEMAAAIEAHLAGQG